MEGKGIELNVGPVHPATHGVLKLVADIEGDTVKNAKVEIGFLHRGKEKIAELRYFNSYFPIVDKLDYVGALNWEILWASTVEKAMNLEINDRVKYIRAVMAEIQRIMSHLVYIGSFGQDLGNLTFFIWALRERELLMDIVEEISGGRLAPMYNRVGGVFYDFTDGIADKINAAISKIEEKVKKEYKAMTYGNSLFIMRSKGIGFMSQKVIKENGVTGPNMRASGIKRDLRKDEPYLVYDKVDFEIITENDSDVYARFMVRVREILESIKIIRQLLKDMPRGDTKISAPWIMKVPAGYTLVRHEMSKGEGAMFLVTDGGLKPYRLKIRSPSFYSLQALPLVLEGCKVADAFVITASMDPVMGEVDR
ncbi:MAG: NADH-quinone oxidoreductase subunit D [Candidatus Acidifodinimicrobium sp.]